MHDPLETDESKIPNYDNYHFMRKEVSSRIEKLEEVLRAPLDDEAGQAHRDELLRYVIVPPLSSRLISSQKVRRFQKTTPVYIQAVMGGESYYMRSSRSARGDLRLYSQFVNSVSSLMLTGATGYAASGHPRTTV